MRGARLAVALVISICGAFCASTAFAKAKRGPEIKLSAPLTLDAYSAGYTYFDNPVSTPRALSSGLYVAVVRGTASFYAAVDYSAIQEPFTAMCGHPLPAPMFSSDGGVGPVGNDAAFVFAEPIAGKSCSTTKLPRAYPNFQVNVGTGWAHGRVVSLRPLTRPSSTHTYTFALDTHGKRVSFRMIDPDTRDDYGSFRIYIRRAVRSDCMGDGHSAFYLSLRACLADTPATAAPKPPAVPRKITLAQSPVTRVLLNSDLQAAINGEVPSGALTAQQFAAIDNTTPAATAAESSLLVQASLRSGAISRFTGVGLPAYKSTAALFSSAAQAQQALRAELSLAPTTQAPTGTTAEPPALDPNVPGAYIITYDPGSLELLAVKDDYLLTLVAVGNPQPVDQTSVEQLFETLLARS